MWNHHRTQSTVSTHSFTNDPTSPILPNSPTVPSTPSYRQKYQGRRIAQIVKLKPEFVKEYKEVHARVWPEVLKQIKDCNIEDCKVFPALHFQTASQT